MRNKPKWYSLLLVGLALLLASSVVGCQAPPTIAFSPPSFSFNAQQGETNLLTDTLHISNSGGGTLDWSVSSDARWLTLSPTSGSLTGKIDEVTVSIELDINRMNVGNYDATITISAPGVSNARQTVAVRLALTENPRYIYENGAIEIGGDGEPIELINNPNATDPTYAELIAFIKEDSTDEHHYATSVDVYVGAAEVPYVCSDFAEAVHNNAEKEGIRATWVSIDFQGNDKGHACNAFETTDRGLVYIDCTGQSFSSKLKKLRPVETEEGFTFVSDSPTSWDAIAYLEIDKEYGVIDVAKAESPLYSFYEEYAQKWQQCEELLTDFNDEVMQFNEEVIEYGKLLSDYNNEVAEYNKEYGEYMRLMASPPNSPWREAAEAKELMFFIQYGRTFEAERRYLEEQGSALKEWRGELEDWEAELVEKSQELDELGEELGDFWVEPLGIVKNIHIHW